MSVCVCVSSRAEIEKTTHTHAPAQTCIHSHPPPHTSLPQLRQWCLRLHTQRRILLRTRVLMHLSSQTHRRGRKEREKTLERKMLHCTRDTSPTHCLPPIPHTREGPTDCVRQSRARKREEGGLHHFLRMKELVCVFLPTASH